MLQKSIAAVEELSGKPLTPDRVINVDETGFVMNMTASYIVTRKNSRHANAATSNSRDHVSAASTIKADGTALPPFFMLAGKRKKNKYLEDDGRIQGTHPGTAFTLTEI